MNLPRRMRQLPTYRGLPVPFVQFVGADGQPDFKVIDEQKKRECLRDRLCGICGQPLDRIIVLIGGEKCVENRLFADPPMHNECARYATKACPYLANADATYSSATPKHAEEGQAVLRQYEMSTLRPKRMALYFTRGYKFGRIRGRGPMTYVMADPPTSIDWEAMPGSPEPKQPKKLWQPGDPMSGDEQKAVDTRITLDLESDLPALIDAMPNGQGILFHNERETSEGRIADAHEITNFTSDDLVTLSKQPNLFHIIATMGRIGAQGYFQRLEQDWFTPGTVLNDDYQWRLFKWNDLVWAIASVPLEKKAICFATAENCRMRLANGIPHVLGQGLPGGGGKVADFHGCPMHQFPLSCDNAWGLENASDSPVYQGPGGRQDEQVREEFDIQQIRRQQGVSE